MTRQTRSNTDLPGNISEYLLEAEQQEMSTGGQEAANTSTGGGGGNSGGSEDMQTLIALMARTLSAISDSRSTSSTNPKLEDCPVKRKLCTLESWIEEVLLWNESYSSSEPGVNGKKYLKFIESVRKAEECTDLQNFVQVEFAENTSFDKKQDDIVSVMINEIKSSLGQSDLDKCSEARAQAGNRRLCRPIEQRHRP